MRYLAASGALKLASLSPTTRATYRALAKARGGIKPFVRQYVDWILEYLPSETSRSLEIGTGWASIYTIIPALLREACECHCFDVADIRHNISRFNKR